MVVKSIGVFSLAKIVAAINAFFGLLFGFVFTLLSLVGAGFGDSMYGGFFALIFGVGGIVILPIFYGIMGFVSGALTGVVYNFVAGMVGGLELDLRPLGPAAPGAPSVDTHRT